MPNVCIYALNDPTTGRTRYIGQSVNPPGRFRAHFNPTPSEKTHKANWVRSLRGSGLRPVLEGLDSVPMAEREFWEKEYIRLYRALFPDLTNGTDGGDGATPGSKQSEETNLKRSISLTGKKRKPFSDEHRENIRRSRVGVKATPLARLNQSVAMIGRRKGGASGICGVFRNGTNTWMAKVKKKYLGNFKTPELAATARKEFIEAQTSVRK